MKHLKKKYNFDLIIHFFVFEHIVNPKKFIKDQLSLIKSKGKIILKYHVI